METTFKKLPSSRISTTTVVTADERKIAEEQALKSLAKRVSIKGFREGMAPPDLVRQRVKPEDVLEETVRALLPKVMAEALKLSNAKPIIRPATNIASLDPLTIILTFVERPAAELKKPEKITVEKKPMPEASSEEVETFIGKLLMQDRTEPPADPATAKEKSDTKLPELTAEFLKSRLGVDRTPEAFRTDVKQMLTGQKRNAEMKRREEELYTKVREATKIDIAPELIDAEVQEMLADLQHRLKEQESTIEKWLETTGKKWEAVVEEMKSIAKDRIILRFGMQLLADFRKAEADPKALEAALAAERAHIKDHGHDTPDSELQPGGNVYEQMRWEKRMQKLVEGMIMDA